MTSPVPAAITSDGNVKVFYTPTVADLANPTVAECTSDAGFDVTCYITDDGWNPSTDENVVTDGRLCSRQVFEDIGTYTDKLQVKYIYRPQEPEADDNMAFRTFKRGQTGVFIVRFGAAFEGDIAAGDTVDTIPFTCDVPQKQQAAANEKLKIMQDMRITNTVNRDVVVVS